MSDKKITANDARDSMQRLWIAPGRNTRASYTLVGDYIDAADREIAALRTTLAAATEKIDALAEVRNDLHDAAESAMLDHAHCDERVREVRHNYLTALAEANERATLIEREVWHAANGHYALSGAPQPTTESGKAVAKLLADGCAVYAERDAANARAAAAEKRAEEAESELARTAEFVSEWFNDGDSVSDTVTVVVDAFRHAQTSLTSATLAEQRLAEAEKERDEHLDAWRIANCERNELAERLAGAERVVAAARTIPPCECGVDEHGDIVQCRLCAMSDQEWRDAMRPFVRGMRPVLAALDDAKGADRG